MSQAFYRKWRPQRWDEVISQEHVITTLRNAVRSGRFAHAYLLAGPRGTGKTTTARLLAKAFNCLDKDPANRPCDTCEHCIAINEARFLDLIEIDAASNTSVDDVRDLREKINFRPTQGEFKVYIIDEVHMLSTAAFNALLKTLEEPPPHAIFILATTEIHKIPATVLSRCQRYEFRRIPVPDIVRHLKHMVEDENIQVDEDVLLLIARQATGAMRDAISLLDQLASTGQRVTLVEAQMVLGTATSVMVIDLIDAILARDAGRGLTLIQTALDAGTDARQFARQVVEYLRSLLLIRMGNANQVDATVEARAQMSAQAQQFDNPRLLETIRLFNTAATDARASWHPGLPLEMAFAESIEDQAPVQTAAQVQPPAQAHSAASRPAPEEPRPAHTPSADRTLPPLPSEERARNNTGAAPRPASVEREQPQQDDRPKPAADKPKSTGAASSTEQTQKPAARSAEKAPSANNAPGTTGSITQNDVHQNWAKVKQAVHGKNKLTSAALNSCRSFAVKDGTLILGFVSEVVKLKMETPENIEILRKALQEIFSATLAIRCVVVGNKAALSNDIDVDGDGMVNAALDLGGKIVYEE